MKEVLTFRVERDCFFGGQFYKATEDVKPDEQGLWMFPSASVLDVPHHFTAIGDDFEIDEEAQSLRDAYWGFMQKEFPKMALSEADHHVEKERIKGNFLKYGQAEAPTDSNGNGVIDPEEMSKKQIIDALRAAGADFKPTETVAELVAKLRAIKQ